MSSFDYPNLEGAVILECSHFCCETIHSDIISYGVKFRLVTCLGAVLSPFKKFNPFVVTEPVRLISEVKSVKSTLCKTNNPWTSRSPLLCKRVKLQTDE